MNKMILVAFYIFIFINSYAVVEKGKEIETKSVKRIIDEKIAEAKKAKDVADMAAKNEKIQEEKIEDYKVKIVEAKNDQEMINSLTTKRAQAEQEVKKQVRIKAQEEERIKKIEQEIETLKKQQNEIESEFKTANNENSYKDDLAECIKDTIIALFQGKETGKSQLDEYVKQLADKLSSLTLYERVNFYKGSEFTRAQWKNLHQQVAANPKNFDPYYSGLLADIEKLRGIIGKIVNNSSLEVPTTESNGSCLAKFYPVLESQIAQREKFIDSTAGESILWNN